MGTIEPEYIAIGQVLAPWGNKGKVKVNVTTDFPQRFVPSSRVYINRRPVIIDSAEWHKGRVIIKIDILNSIEEVRKLRGQTIEIHRSQLKPLPEGHYYLFQIIGLMVSTTQGEPLGRITEILTTEGNDTYVVKGNRGETLIPAISDVIRSVDLDQGQMVIDPIEGLLSLNQKATD